MGKKGKRIKKNNRKMKQARLDNEIKLLKEKAAQPVIFGIDWGDNHDRKK